MTKLSGRFVFISAGAIALVLTIDAARDTNWDMFVMALAIDGLLLLLAVQMLGSGVPVRVRRDLFRWARTRAAATHQTVERIVDRAVATYRERIEPSPFRPVEAPDQDES